MRRIALPLALLFALVAPPAVAFDLGRLLPMPEVPVPDWLSADAPDPVDATAPRGDATVAPPLDPRTADAAPPVAADPARPASKPASRPRGWRSLLPGSIK